MKYAVSPDVPWSNVNAIEVPQSRYMAIRQARLNLYAALSAEEKAAIVLANFEEFEREILEQTLKFMLYPGTRSWSESVETIQCINRRIVNFTSTCRVYIDHIRQDLRIVFSADSDEMADLNKAFSIEYDSNLAYRVMESIRNYAQHQSLPITGLNSNVSGG